MAVEAAPADAGDPRAVGREAEARLREGGGGAVAMLEVTNWQLVQEQLSGDDQRALRAVIAETISAAGIDGAAQEVAEGRYSVLVNGADEVAGIVRRLDKLVRGSPAGSVARVDGLGLSLGAGTLTPSQAARALRYTLSRFRSGGADAARVAGGAAGLAGVFARAAHRTRMLRAAIADGRFEMKYQPVVALVERGVHHFEALIRPAGTLVEPSQTAQDFVVSVEAMGLTEELDCAVTEMVLATLRGHADASVAVNVSGLSMQSPTFRDRMFATFAGAGGPDVTRRLLLELTETVEVEEMATAAANIAAFRELGIPVCLDDFGAGGAAFRYLREFQVDFVKIDGQYVRRAALGPRERSFVTSMVDLAAGVGARVIAECVETEAEAQLMRVLGVELGQGWLFGRPGVLPGKDRA
jgi:EAL domain-containing protein (putative c-di-GMP-specific phosphodiesterase class I)